MKKVLIKKLVIAVNDCWTDQDHKEILKKSTNVLWRFIQNNSKLNEAKEVCANVLDLSEKDLKLLKHIHFLLDEQIINFINKTAPKILNRLSKTSYRRRRTVKGAVKGKLDMLATVKHQAVVGGNSNEFVVLDWSSDFDVMENRLMKYILNKILISAQKVTGNDLENEVISREDSQKWVDKAAVIEKKTHKLLRNVYLKQVENLHEISKHIIEQVDKVRGHWYKDLVKVSNLYFKVFEEESNNRFLESLLKKRFFEPLDRNTLYELYTLSNVIITIKNSDWKICENNLITHENDVISKYIKNKNKLIIYYQNLPKEMKKESKYGDVLNNYGFSNYLRRPDIILEYIEDGKKSFCIIEVKRSKSRSYLVEGIYKLMGYQKDFESCLNNGLSEVTGILVGWSGFKKKVDSIKSDIMLANKNNLQEVLSEVI